MPFTVLMANHWMIGVDSHDGIPPPGPVVVPMIPHMVSAQLMWITPFSAPTIAKPVLGPTSFPMMKMGSDISNLIPHIGINYLAPLLTLTSGSKSHFGSSSVQSNSGPLAAAISGVMNFNLNCSGSTMPPLPSGFVFAPNTVLVGMSLGDVLGGGFAMVADSLLTLGLNKLFETQLAQKLLSKLAAPLIRKLLPNAPAMTSLTTAMFAQASPALNNPFVAHNAGNAIPALVGFVLGSPLGYTPPTGVVGNYVTTPVSDGARSMGESLGNSIDSLTDDPETPEYPQQAPSSGDDPDGGAPEALPGGI
jgi:hypothetical protein